MRYRLFMMSLISIFIAIAYFLYTMYPQLGVISKIELVYGVLLNKIDKEHHKMDKAIEDLAEKLESDIKKH